MRPEARCRRGGGTIRPSQVSSRNREPPCICPVLREYTLLTCSDLTSLPPVLSGQNTCVGPPGFRSTLGVHGCCVMEARPGGMRADQLAQTACACMLCLLCAGMWCASCWMAPGSAQPSGSHDMHERCVPARARGGGRHAAAARRQHAQRTRRCGHGCRPRRGGRSPCPAGGGRGCAARRARRPPRSRPPCTTPGGEPHTGWPGPAAPAAAVTSVTPAAAARSSRSHTRNTRARTPPPSQQRGCAHP